jgi:hypothetical protein
MLRKALIAAAVSLGIAFGANAQTIVQQTSPSRQALPDEVVQVQHDHSFDGGAVIRDTFGGAVLGAAAGVGYAYYNKEENNGGNWGNWQRPVFIGAGIGAAVGLVFGIVDASTYSDRAPTPYADQRETGFAPPAAQYGVHF